MTASAPIRGLRYGPLGRHAVHVAIDMQRLFAEPGDWYTPALAGIVPPIARLARHRPARTLFTRFLTAPNAEAARGQWQQYYRRWHSVTADRLAPGMLDLVPELAGLAGAGQIIDKYEHSAFESPDLGPALARLEADTLIVTGVETEVCVLATVLTAIDRGFRVVLIEDAVASSSEAGHRAALEAVYPRFDEQIELIDTTAALAAWKD